jgi:homoserine O-succinyltransferase/O-acetyltransferase
MLFHKDTLKVAILDMYEGKENQGMRCIRELLNQFAESVYINLDFDEYDVRQTAQLPDMSYDIYISTGGPGSPLESQGNNWDNAWCDWLEGIFAYNNNPINSNKKHVLLICHSFQLAARHLQIGTVSKRKSTSFGVFPVHMLQGANTDVVFQGLKDPFYVVDSRDWQVTAPNNDIIEQLGATLLCIEKERPHVPLERAIMAFRLNNYMIGTQFHPEADAVGMHMYLTTTEKKQIVIEQHGQEKWTAMVQSLLEPDKILHTYSHIIPNFLRSAAGILEEI